MAKVGYKRQSRRTVLQPVLCLFLLLLVILTPLGSVQAQNPVAEQPLFRYTDYIQHALLKRDGTIEVKAQIDITFNRDGSTFAFEIPYGDRQSVALTDLRFGEIAEDLRGMNYLGTQVTGEITERTSVGSYRVTDRGTALHIQMVAAVPRDGERRLLVSYTVFQAARRYRDVGEVNFLMLNGRQNFGIEKLHLSVNVESSILDIERGRYRLFERNNLPTTDPYLIPQKAGTHLTSLRVPDETGVTLTHDAWLYQAEFLPVRTRMRARIILPSVWLARTRFDDSVEGDQFERILEEEETYERQIRTRYQYQVVINRLLILLTLLALILLMYFQRTYLFQRYRKNLSKVSALPEIYAPGLIAYFQSGKLDGRVILSTVYRLTYLGYLELDDLEISRVDERLTPDNSNLRPYEISILHLIWNLMDGEISLTLHELDKSVQELESVDLMSLNRIRNLLEAELMMLGLIDLPGDRQPGMAELLIGIAYLLFAGSMMIIGSYYIPLILLIPALVFIYLASRTGRYTAKGRDLIKNIQAYADYLSDIDRQGLTPQALRETLDYHFYFSVALGVEKPFLTGLRYVMNLETIIYTDLLPRYGFGKLQTVLETYLDRKGHVNARYVRMVFVYVDRQIGQKISEIQSAIIRLRLRRLPDLRQIEEELDEA